MKVCCISAKDWGQWPLRSICIGKSDLKKNDDTADNATGSFGDFHENAFLANFTFNVRRSNISARNLYDQRC